MSVDITIQETVNEVDITVVQNVITVNVTRTTGSGGVESVTGTLVDNTDPLNPVVNVPTISQVLTVGDKEFQQIPSDRDFELADRLKYSVIAGGMTMTLDDDLDLFPVNSLIQFVVEDNSDINATATLNFGAATNCYYLIQNITTLTLNVGDFCELKKAGAGTWILNVWNKGSGGVESVTGTLVDNTDPNNPVINTPNIPTKTSDLTNDGENNTSTFVESNELGAVAFSNDYNDLGNKPTIPSLQNLTQTLAIDNKTNDIPIISNNGNAVVTVNDDYLQIGYFYDYLILHPTLGLASSSNIKVYTAAPEMEVVIGGTISYTCPSFLLNTQEVATQPYADAKVANDLTASTTVAPSKTAVFDALDFTRRLITKGTGSVTGTVSETIITTLTIPANTLDSSCFIWTTMDFFKTNSGTVTIRLYINNANTLTGATLLGYSTLGSIRNVSFNRKFLVTGTSLDLLTANTASSQASNEFIEALYGASTVLTINPSADIFLIYTTQNDITGTVATNKMATVQKMKL